MFLGGDLRGRSWLVLCGFGWASGCTEHCRPGSDRATPCCPVQSFQLNSVSSLLLLVQSLSRVRLSVTPWAAARQASLSFTISRSLLKPMSTESVMPCKHLILCRPVLLLPSGFPSIRVFSNESALRIRWPKYWSFSFCPSNEYSGWTSFRMDLFDLLAVQGTLKSLLTLGLICSSFSSFLRSKVET